MANRSRGQALVEVMIAVGILSVGFLGVISLLSKAFGLNRVVSDNYVGTYLAAEGIEVAKNIIDNNIVQGLPWNDGISDGDFEVDHSSMSLDQSYTGRTLSYSPSTHLYDYSGGNPTTYRRRVSIQLPGQNEIRVSSEVTWLARGGGTSEVQLEDHFFNWR